jgi:16S rRNA (cytosine1402-N4)-methyltransferase
LDDDSTVPMSADDRGFQHQPVMVAEIVEVFATVPAGVVLDATLGGGGHSEALLERRPDLRILGIDRDPAALAAATRRLARFGDRVTTVHARFDDLDHAMQTLRSRDDSRGIPRLPGARSDETLGIPRHPASRLSGALFDLGVSSPQLDEAGRGFSYRQEGPLDMRMDPTTTWSASDVVNGYPVDDLARVLRRYGDERFAGRIARAIVAARPIETTTELAAIVTAAIPAAARRTGGHPAKRTFQAIRIEVNAELTALPEALDAAIDATAPGGRIAVLSYHSGEDRIVKERFRRATGACDCPPGLPCVCGAVQTVRIVRRIPKRPSAAEVEANPRAASARLRVVERVEHVEHLDHLDHLEAEPEGDDA